MSEKQRDLRSELRVAMAALSDMEKDQERFLAEQYSKHVDVSNLLYSIEFELRKYKRSNSEESDDGQ